MAHWREHSGPFAAYLEQPYPGIPRNRPKRVRSSSDIFDDSNRKPARSIIEDLIHYVLKPITLQIMTVGIYYLAVLEDIIYTWDWGPYRGYDHDYTRLQFRHYTKGDDEDSVHMASWSDRHSVDF